MINISTGKLEERAVLVGIITNSQKEDQVNEYLDDLLKQPEQRQSGSLRKK